MKVKWSFFCYWPSVISAFLIPSLAGGFQGPGPFLQLENLQDSHHGIGWAHFSTEVFAGQKGGFVEVPLVCIRQVTVTITGSGLQ